MLLLLTTIEQVLVPVYKVFLQLLAGACPLPPGALLPGGCALRGHQLKLQRPAHPPHLEQLHRAQDVSAKGVYIYICIYIYYIYIYNIYIYIYICVCVCVCVYIYMYIYTCMYIVYIYIYIYVCVCVCVCIYIYMCMFYRAQDVSAKGDRKLLYTGVTG